MMRTGSLTICVLLFFNLVLIARPQAMISPSTDGRAAAEYWLSLLDRGCYAASWNLATRSFQSRINRNKWIAGMKKIRMSYGKVQSRKFENSAFDVNPPGLPSGEYETLWYKIRLAAAGTAMEVVSMKYKGGGKWRVSAFSIVTDPKGRSLPL